jgi:acetolactate synthase regulatory subunit
MIQRLRALNRTQQAALEALERLYMRTVRHRGAVITHQEMARPIAIAHAAMEVKPCAQ